MVAAERGGAVATNWRNFILLFGSIRRHIDRAFFGVVGCLAVDDDYGVRQLAMSFMIDGDSNAITAKPRRLRCCSNIISKKRTY